MRKLSDLKAGEVGYVNRHITARRSGNAAPHTNGIYSIDMPSRRDSPVISGGEDIDLYDSLDEYFSSPLGEHVKNNLLRKPHIRGEYDSYILDHLGLTFDFVRDVLDIQT